MNYIIEDENTGSDEDRSGAYRVQCELDGKLVELSRHDTLGEAGDWIRSLGRDTVFPSARALLEAGISCKAPGKGGWAIYWMEGGAELTLFPRNEGPQEASSIDEVIEWVGGDQPAALTPASLRRFGVR